MGHFCSCFADREGASPAWWIQDEASAEFAGNVSSDDTADLTQLRAPDDKISEMPSHPTRPKMETFNEIDASAL